jgi:hypothetical protein
MREQTSTATTGGQPLNINEPEMVIEWSKGYWFAFQGTRAQLEAEGVVPAGLNWPTGRREASLITGGRRYLLRRCGIPGAKQSIGEWSFGDWWRVHVLHIDPNRLDPELERCTNELHAMIHARTPQGRAEFNAKYRLYYAACEDEKFQAFKALIPALIPPPRKRRGRPLKAVTSPA